MPHKGDTIRFRNNVIQIFSSGMLSQAIVVFGTLILTRFYNPADFGVLSVFSANFALLAGVFVLKYDLSIVAEHDDIRAFGIATLCIMLSAVFSGLLFLGLLASIFMGWMSLGWYNLLLPLVTFLAAVCSSLQQCGARQLNYKRYSFSSITNAVLSLSVSLVLIWMFPGFREGLIIGMACGWVGSTLMFTTRSASAKALFLNFKGQSFDKLVSIALKNKYFPLYVLPISVLVIFATSGQFFILNHYFSPAEVGIFGIAFRFLVLPMSTIGAAVSESFRSEFAHLVRQKRPTKKLLIKTLMLLVSVGFVAFSVAFLLSPKIFPLLLGSGYSESGVLAQYLCLGMFAQFIAQPFMNILITGGRLGLALITQFFATTVPLVSLLVGAVQGSLHLALIYNSVATAITAILVVVISYIYSQVAIQIADVEPAPIQEWNNQL
jgi:O-antigen/teichoic acid export membrane protein